jgi:lipid A 3-O-deacylase
MVKCLLFVLTGFLFFPRQVSAQAIDNSVSYRDISSEKYFRINYENDFFSAFDRDYTQGILIEKVHPMFKRFFLTKLLWHPAYSEIKYGVAVEQDAYTPNEIDQYDIQYGDRPYAGVLLFKTFLIATNTEHKRRITVTLSTGVVGEGAGGEQMQRTIHHWINYTQPQGWHNQIQNDAALNYQVNIEQEIYQYGNLFSFSAYGSGRVGTLNDKLTGGFTAMFGKFQSPFANPVILNRHFHWYLYDQLTGNAVGYDATLQGGLFNHTSPYAIPPSQICRLTVQNKFGIVLVFRSLYIEYYHTGLTEEFVTSIYHRTGGLQIGFGF